MSWEETKRRMQSAFQVLRGSAVAFEWDRARKLLLLEHLHEEAWQEHQAELAAEARMQETPEQDYSKPDYEPEV